MLKQSGPFFLDVLKESGIVFKNAAPVLDKKISHVNPLLANYVSAAAVGDFNNDGYDDIFFVSNYKGQPNALYKNKGNLKFEDVTKGSGVADLNDEDNFCSGALWFDYDNDNLTDLFISRFGHSLLFKNNGNGTFRNVTVQANIGVKRQNTLAVIAFDYNKDGYLDLLTGGFFADDVNLLNLKSTKFLPTSDQKSFNGGSKILYKNNGDGTFSDVTAQAGISDTGFTAALGEADYDNDGWQDFYVANDFGPDRLYRNNGNDGFIDVSKDAIGIDGRKGMNVDWADYNSDGFLDLYVTNITESWQRECNMLWVNTGDGIFYDYSIESNTCNTGWGWGAKFFDYDNNGLLDLYVANGYISAGQRDYFDDLRESRKSPSAKDDPLDIIDASSWPSIINRSFAGYERNCLFENQGTNTFKDIAARAGVDSILDSRGVALADFDNDGAMDLLVTTSNHEPLLYHNLIGKKKNWLELRLVGTQSNTNAVGARLKITTGRKSQIREVTCGNGYQSQSSFMVHIGLGAISKVDAVEIKWPGGLKQSLRNVRANQVLTVIEKPDNAAQAKTVKGRTVK